MFCHCTVSMNRENLSQENLSPLNTVRYFGNVTRHNCVEKDITLGTVPGMRQQGGQRRQWLDDITQWSGKRLVDIVSLAENRDQYRRFVFEAANARFPGTVNFQ